MVNLAILSADWHMSQQVWANRPQLRGDAERALSQIVDLAIQYGVPLIGAGDLLNVRRPSAGTVAATYRQLSRLAAAGLTCYYIQGQHEFAGNSPEDSPWLSFMPGTVHIHKQTVLCQSVRFYGLDYTPPTMLHEELASIPSDTDVFVAHQVWQESMPFGAEASFADVPAKFMVTGDLHQTKVYELPDRQVLSPGATHMRKIDEPSTHSVFLLSRDATALRLTELPLQSRRVVRWTVATESTLRAAITDYIDWYNIADDPLMVTPIVHVTYDKDLPDVHSVTTSLLGDKAHLFFTPYGDDLALTREAVSVRSSIGLTTELSHMRDMGHIDDVVYRGVLRLLGSTDPEQTLAADYQKVLQQDR